MPELTRRARETIVIGDDIRVTVLVIGDGEVKLGVETPPGVTVRRDETIEKPKEDE